MCDGKQKNRNIWASAQLQPSQRGEDRFDLSRVLAGETLMRISMFDYEGMCRVRGQRRHLMPA